MELNGFRKLLEPPPYFVMALHAVNSLKFRIDDPHSY